MYGPVNSSTFQEGCYTARRGTYAKSLSPQYIVESNLIPKEQPNSDSTPVHETDTRLGSALLTAVHHREEKWVQYPKQSPCGSGGRIKIWGDMPGRVNVFHPQRTWVTQRDTDTTGGPPFVPPPQRSLAASTSMAIWTMSSRESFCAAVRLSYWQGGWVFVRPEMGRKTPSTQHRRLAENKH